MNFLIFAQGTAMDLQSFVSLAAGLGQSGLAVTMAWLFIKYLQEERSNQEKRDERVFSQFSDLAKDRGQIIRDNTAALAKIEASVDRLIDVAESRTTPAPSRQDSRKLPGGN
jgi:hypothetical protein